MANHSTYQGNSIDISGGGSVAGCSTLQELAGMGLRGAPCLAGQLAVSGPCLRQGACGWRTMRYLSGMQRCGMGGLDFAWVAGACGCMRQSGARASCLAWGLACLIFLFF